MKKFILMILVVLLASVAFSADKGHISLTAKVEIYDPPGSAKIAPMFTIKGKYRFNAFLAATGSGSWTQYNYNDAEITYIPIAVDGEVHPFGIGVFDPYTGVGLGVNFRQYDYTAEQDDKTELTIGAELLGGVTYKPKNQFGFEFDFKYRVEDIANANETGSWSLGGGVTGSWEKDL
ncbi:outer membrane beta-barrel protein [bacterium]|nr:outer membrane beta-barrel protein [bacterium]